MLYIRFDRLPQSKASQQAQQGQAPANAAHVQPQGSLATRSTAQLANLAEMAFLTHLLCPSSGCGTRVRSRRTGAAAARETFPWHCLARGRRHKGCPAALPLLGETLGRARFPPGGSVIPAAARERPERSPRTGDGGRWRNPYRARGEKPGRSRADCCRCCCRVPLSRCSLPTALAEELRSCRAGAGGAWGRRGRRKWMRRSEQPPLARGHMAAERAPGLGRP